MIKSNSSSVIRTVGRLIIMGIDNDTFEIGDEFVDQRLVLKQV